jgi:hypothetical protein
VNRYKCYGKHAKAQFSLKVGTIFEDSPISLNKWLCAMWLMRNMHIAQRRRRITGTGGKDKTARHGYRGARR